MVVLGDLAALGINEMKLNLYKILDNREIAIKYHTETYSRYTSFNRVNNQIMSIVGLLLFAVSYVFDFYMLLLLPFYVIFTIVINVLDYRVRKLQLFDLINQKD